ncbi:hypothetical protein EV700_2643 [Fluviicoccus keumensis]|uniref:Uncharacterized protein n=1 Tax=Fluviicoccus keumensis TaxID=1435465 RepID=A0A4Q7YMX9_9GAMM|nr:hypothetical protein EV700_2643 [Fluviicoccus keumensis]
MKLSNAKKIAICMLAWLAAVIAHGWYYVSSVLVPGPLPDPYANEVSFQLLMFAVFRFPIWFAALGVIIWLALRYRTVVPNHSLQARRP